MLSEDLVFGSIREFVLLNDCDIDGKVRMISQVSKSCIMRVDDVSSSIWLRESGVLVNVGPSKDNFQHMLSTLIVAIR